jgi:hypothetical protein
LQISRLGPPDTIELDHHHYGIVDNPRAPENNPMGGIALPNGQV